MDTGLREFAKASFLWIMIHLTVKLFTGKKGDSMELANGIELGYADGKLSISVAVKDLVSKELDMVQAKIESGAIDLFPGDMDKVAMLAALAALKGML